jgi:hypothetical protein
MEPTPKQLYSESILSELERRRGPVMILAPADYALIDGWYSRGVPLRVVLAGMALAQGVPRTLRFFEGAVEDEIRRVERAMA